jgi:hypothetical protein
MERVLEHVNSSSYVPVTRSKLADDVKGNRSYLLQAIDILIDEGNLRLQDRKIVTVPVPRNVPGTFPSEERNGNVPRSSSLQEERLSGTTFEGVR